jgi:hypothetical protein
MGLLDRFKTPPRWKHTDPDVRLGGVKEIPDEDQDLLVAIAHEDTEPRVRRAAVARLTRIPALGDVLRTEQDDAVKALAASQLVGLAVARSDPEDQTALHAVEALIDPKHLAIVAKEASDAEVGRAALARLQEPRVLGSVARNAALQSVRLDALSRLSDVGELVSVAVRTEHKDVAVAAVDRLADPDALGMVASRARSKAAARRARALLSQATGQPIPPEPDEATRRIEDLTELCESLERLSGAGANAFARHDLARAESRWTTLVQDGHVDPVLSARFAAARAALETRLAEREAQRAAIEQRAQATADAVAARVRLCEAVEALAVSGATDRVDIARAEWEGLPAIEDPQREALTRRFNAAVEACRNRAAALRVLEETAARQADLAHAAEELAAMESLRDVQVRWSGIKAEWNRLRSSSEPATEAAERFEGAEARVRGRETDARDSQEKQQREAIRRVEERCAQLEGLVAAEQLGLKQAERALRELRSLGDRLAGQAPTAGERSTERSAQPPRPPVELPRATREQFIDRLKRVQAVLYPRLQELREADDWQRWANAAVQEKLCARAEALHEASEPAEVVRLVRQLQAEWQLVAAGPRTTGEALWRRFKSALDEARVRCQTYFAEQAARRAANLERKEALCQHVEALADSTRWTEAAERIKSLQADWKAVGPALQEKALWERFRSACDRFFTRRKAHLDERKREWSANLERKEGLCRRAEALEQSTDWDAVVAELKRLRVEWKGIGPVRRAKSEAIWNRFRSACDRVVARYAHRDAPSAPVVGSEWESLCLELEGLAPDGEPSPDLTVRLLGLRDRWRQFTARGGEGPRSLEDRFEAGLVRIAQAHPALFAGTDLDLEANRRTLEDLCRQVEGLTSTQAGPPTGVSPVAVLATQLREALATNTIGGRVDEDTKRKTAIEDVRQAQAAWKRTGPVPDAIRRPLAIRFQRACNQFFDERRRSQEIVAKRR